MKSHSLITILNMSFPVALRSARPAPVIATLAAGGIGAGIMAKLLFGNASAESDAPTKIFKGGPAFVSLPLESAELVNHNTKRLRFKLPQENAVSGLPLTCKHGGWNTQWVFVNIL